MTFSNLFTNRDDDPFPADYRSEAKGACTGGEALLSVEAIHNVAIFYCERREGVSSHHYMRDDTQTRKNHAKDEATSSLACVAHKTLRICERRRIAYSPLAGLLTLSILVLPLLLGSGCASSSPQLSIPIAGGQSVSLGRQGSGFKPAENGRVVITDAGMQTVSLDGNYYVRWSFSIWPKQAAELSAIRIEDVTDPAPLLLVNDVAPQQDGGKWTENAGLMELSSTSVRWLFEPKQTVRVFRLTINEADGRSYVLYQGALYSSAAKDAIRAMVGH